MPTLNDADFKLDVIYQVVLDRFFDGDPANNDPPGDKGLYDPTKTNWKKYWGGDLAGLTQKLPYIAGMGVGAIWISPAVENVHKLVNGTDAGYHGYWGRDFYHIDPHLGTWADFDKLVATAHAHGIKIIIDSYTNWCEQRACRVQEICYTGGTNGRTVVRLYGLCLLRPVTGLQRLFPVHQGHKRRLGLLQLLSSHLERRETGDPA